MLSCFSPTANQWSSTDSAVICSLHPLPPPSADPPIWQETKRKKLVVHMKRFLVTTWETEMYKLPAVFINTRLHHWCCLEEGTEKTLLLHKAQVGVLLYNIYELVTYYYKYINISQFVISGFIIIRIISKHIMINDT